MKQSGRLRGILVVERAGRQLDALLDALPERVLPEGQAGLRVAVVQDEQGAAQGAEAGPGAVEPR